MAPANVLIVDDSHENRQELCNLIRALGHEPFEVDGIRSATQWLDTRPSKQRCDLVLLDYHLRPGTGVKLLEFIKSQPETFPFLPVIIVSINDSTEKIVECFRAGADDYVVNRPYAPEELNARVQNVLERYRLMRELREEKEWAARILRSILPERVADRVVERRQLPEPRRAGPVAVLFSDIYGFTADSESKTPREVFGGLHALFTEFEGLARHHQVEKIKTVGDAFMATAGLLEPTDSTEAVRRCVKFGKAIVAKAQEFQYRVRVGIHVGDVFAGFLGKERFLYDLLGHTVNLASRIEGVAKPDGICVSHDAYKEIEDLFPNCRPVEVSFKNVSKKEVVHHVWPQE